MTELAHPDDFFDADVSDLPLVGNAPAPEPSGAGAFLRHGMRAALPTTGGVAAFPAGFAGGGAIGGPFAEITAPLGGFAAAMGAGALIDRFQGEALDKHPAFAASIGIDDQALAADQAAHPWASLAGGLAPQVAFFRPGRLTWKGAAAGGAIGAGVAGGMELAQTGHISLPNLMLNGVGGAFLNHPTKLGELTMGGWLAGRFSSSGGATTARMAADDATSAGAAEFHVDEAEVLRRADAIGETHPNLSPATRASYARAELLSEHAGVHATPDERAARTVIEGDAQAEAANPFHGTGAAAAHGERLAAATAAMADDRPMPDLSLPERRLDRDSVIDFIIDQQEGGAKPVVDSGGLTRFGVSQDGHPGIDVAHIGRGTAAMIYRNEYWNALGLDNVEPRLAAVAMDAAINHGPGRAREMLVESGGDPARLIELRRAEYARLIEQNPGKYARYEHGWANRLERLEGFIGGRDVALRPDILSADAESSSAPASAEDYVDRYLRGDGRGASIADLEMQQWAADNGGAIEAEFARRLSPDGLPRNSPSAVLSPSVAGGAASAVDRGAPASTPKGDAGAATIPQFDPYPHVAALRDYVNGRGNSLEAKAVAAKLGLQVDEARRVIGALAATRDPGVFISRSGKLRRVIARRGPVDVLTFLTDRGGIRDDEGHDLRKGRGLQRMIPGAGPLIRKSGMSIDAAGELLHEARYFYGDRPTENEVLQLIERASREKVFKPDEAAIAAETARGQRMSEEETAARDELVSAAEAYGGLDDEQTELAVSFMARGETAEDAALMAVEQLAGERLQAGAIETDNPAYDYDIPGFDDRARTEQPKGWDPFAEDGFGDAAASRPAGEGQGGDAGNPRRGGQVREPAAEDLGGPRSLERYSDPGGDGARRQADIIEHDLRMAVDPASADRQRQQAALGAASPLRKPVEQEATMGLGLFDQADQPQFRLSDEGAPTSIKQVLDEIDADRAAVDALRGCMPGAA